LGWGAWLREQVYPRSGFKRATRYVVYRMRRLPDQPHRVARGVFAGFFIGFLPLPGLQFLAAWGMARLLRGNVLAALLGTFNTNPLTTPPFTVFSVWLGHWLLGIEAPLNAKYILARWRMRAMTCGSTSWRCSGPRRRSGTDWSSSGTRSTCPGYRRAWSGHRDQRHCLLRDDPAGRGLSEGPCRHGA
jgi:hypothetical protein